MLELCLEFVTSFRIYMEVNSLKPNIHKATVSDPRSKDGGSEGRGGEGTSVSEDITDLTRRGGVLGCSEATTPSVTLSGAAVRRRTSLHRDFRRTNRFLLLLLKSFVKRTLSK